MIPRHPYYPVIPAELETLLRAESLELFGVAEIPGPPATTEEREYGEWIRAGYQGGMDYLARNASMKHRPERVMPGCRSVVMVGLNYYQPLSGANGAGGTAGAGQPMHAGPATGRVARYAWGRDYHNAFGKRLKRVVRSLRERYPEERFRAFVDASPLSERFLAARAGIGFTAKNTLTITGAYGSWFFLGEILATLPYPPTGAPSGTHGGCPTGCFRCGSACPTGALLAPYRIDATRCISYLTIEHRGSIDEVLRPLMGDWIFGCDRCQEVCPLNVRARTTTVPDFTVHRAGERPRLADLLAVEDQQEFRARFAGTPLLRPGRAAMVRNAAIAAANTGASELLPRLRELTRDADAVVREHARWAVARLGEA